MHYCPKFVTPFQTMLFPTIPDYFSCSLWFVTQLDDLSPLLLDLCIDHIYFTIQASETYSAIVLDSLLLKSKPYLRLDYVYPRHWIGVYNLRSPKYLKAWKQHPSSLMQVSKVRKGKKQKKKRCPLNSSDGG